MSRFPLKEATITVRDTAIRVRELTHAERTAWLTANVEDKTRVPALVASMGLLDPKMTEDEAAAEPGGVIQEIVVKILELSSVGKKNDAAEKE